MLTRRETIAMLGVLPLSAAAAPIASLPQPETFALENVTPDRELHLRIKDNFGSQSWTYAGQQYVENRGTIVVEEDEHIRLRITNDMKSAQSLRHNGVTFRCNPGETIEFDWCVESLDATSIENLQTGFARRISVRPTYQRHAIFTA